MFERSIDVEKTKFFRPTINDILYYNHLDLLFPENPDKHDEYADKLPEEFNWHPYDWGHRSGN